MELPKYHETFVPILQVLAKQSPLHRRELEDRVRNRFYSQLPKELLEKQTSTGATVFQDRVSWGKSYLKMGKFVEYPARGMVQITEKGRMVLKGGSLTLSDLQNDPDFLEYRSKQKKHASKQVNQFLEEKASPSDLMQQGYEEIREQVELELLERLREMNPYDFELIILKLLRAMGYGEVIETAKSRDGGVDGIVNQDHLGLEKVYIQAKRYHENKVREKDIRNFIGAMSGDTNKGIFVTTSDFDEQATQKAREAHHTIVLIDGYRLAELS